MQGLAQLLVIEDDPAIRQSFRTILEFVGEQCEVIDSSQADRIDWSAPWSGCILGSITTPLLSDELTQALSQANHIPLLVANQHIFLLNISLNLLVNWSFPLTIHNSVTHCVIVKSF